MSETTDSNIEIDEGGGVELLSAEDKARKEAEVRRQKILAKAGNRLDMVAGIVDSSAVSSASVDNEDTANVEEEDGGGGGVEKKTSSSKAAKMAALRRRRFKKTALAETKKEEEELNNTETKTTITGSNNDNGDSNENKEISPDTPIKEQKQEGATPAVEAEKAVVVEPIAEGMVQVEPTVTPPVVQEEKTAPVVQEETKNPYEAAAVSPVMQEDDKTKPEEVAESPAAQQEEEETTTKPDEVAGSAATTNEEEPKKKYMGVAKMRRKMIKERYAAAQQQQEESDGDGATATTMPNVDAPAVVLKSNKKIKIYYTLPIMMHVVVVLLLFLAGLEIGLQQSQFDYVASDLIVHTTLAPQQELRLLTKIFSSGRTTPSSKNKDPPAVVLDQVAQERYAAGAAEEDEFQDFAAGEQGSKPENIDPLFQVDLDQYTKGPGLIMMAGRFAVACHRLNLAILYYFPLSILQRILSTIMMFLRSPPMLCLVALSIRQVIGKVILGARLPEIEKEQEGKDVLSMVKNFVSNFLLKAFPTAANIYDAWTHLRSDMYVVLCGLFVGIAWHHQFLGATTLMSEGVADDLVTATTDPLPDLGAETMDPPGIRSDEL